MCVLRQIRTERLAWDHEDAKVCSCQQLPGLRPLIGWQRCIVVMSCVVPALPGVSAASKEFSSLFFQRSLANTVSPAWLWTSRQSSGGRVTRGAVGKNTSVRDRFIHFLICRGRRRGSIGDWNRRWPERILALRQVMRLTDSMIRARIRHRLNGFLHWLDRSPEAEQNFLRGRR